MAQWRDEDGQCEASVKYPTSARSVGGGLAGQQKALRDYDPVPGSLNPVSRQTVGADFTRAVGRNVQSAQETLALTRELRLRLLGPWGEGTEANNKAQLQPSGVVPMNATVLHETANQLQEALDHLRHIFSELAS